MEKQFFKRKINSPCSRGNDVVEHNVCLWQITLLCHYDSTLKRLIKICQIFTDSNAHTPFISRNLFPWLYDFPPSLHPSPPLLTPSSLPSKPFPLQSLTQPTPTYPRLLLKSARARYVYRTPASPSASLTWESRFCSAEMGLGVGVRKEKLRYRATFNIYVHPEV